MKYLCFGRETSSLDDRDVNLYMLHTEGIIVPEQYIWNHSVFNTFTWRPIITQSEVEESPLGAFAFRLTPRPERMRCPGLPTWDRLRACKHVIPQTHTYRHTRACLQRNKQLSGNFEIHRKKGVPPPKPKVFRNAAFGLLCQTRTCRGTCFQHPHSG